MRAVKRRGNLKRIAVKCAHNHIAARGFFGGRAEITDVIGDSTAREFKVSREVFVFMIRPFALEKREIGQTFVFTVGVIFFQVIRKRLLRVFAKPAVHVKMEPLLGVASRNLIADNVRGVTAFVYMIYNGEKIDIEEVAAMYAFKKHETHTYIEVLSKKGERIAFTWKGVEPNPKSLEKNKTIDLVPYLLWDVTLSTKETYYLFDLTKEKVKLTRLDDNLFRLEVYIENLDIVYSPLSENASFKSLIIDVDSSFCYECKEALT